MSYRSHVVVHGARFDSGRPGCRSSSTLRATAGDHPLSSFWQSRVASDSTRQARSRLRPNRDRLYGTITPNNPHFSYPTDTTALLPDIGELATRPTLPAALGVDQRGER